LFVDQTDSSFNHTNTPSFTPIHVLLRCRICDNINAEFMLPVSRWDMIKGEFFIPTPLPCQRHNLTTIKNCSTDVYYPGDNFLKIPIVVCKLYKITVETTTYFFGAKTNNNYTHHLQCLHWHTPRRKICTRKNLNLSQQQQILHLFKLHLGSC